jgi:TonB-linked SusC/RagA family outer membrane protein
MVGYRPSRQQVSIGSGETVIATFELEQHVLILDEVIVTGTAGGAQKRTLGNAVGNISTADIVESAPVGDVSQLLNARVPGVVIQPPGGHAAAGARILVRGRSSMSLTSDPLVFVDGVRVDNRMPTSGTNFNATSALNDFNPRDIESIEIIKGPAAATLYGTEASNGVIQIITKRGQPGRTELGVSITQGVSFQWNPEKHWPVMWIRDPGDIPEPGEPGVTLEGDGVWTWNIIKAEQDRGTPIYRTGHLQGYGVNVSGSSDVLGYYAAGNFDRIQGTVGPDNKSSFAGRLNLNASPHSTVDLRTNFALISSSADIPPHQLKRNALINRPATRNTPRRGFLTAPHEVWAASELRTQNVTRATGGLEIRHNPFSWLSHRLQTGVDINHLENINLIPKLGPDNAQFFSEQYSAGSKEVDLSDVLTTTVDYSATATAPVWESLESSFTTGFQYYRSFRKLFNQEGREFPSASVTSIAGAAIRLGSEDQVENVTVGLFVQEQLAWKNRLFLTGAVRFDDNSAFGENFELVTYPKVSGSWVVSEEPFWNVPMVNLLRLRAAYGESGLQPEAFAALRTFEPITGQGGSPAVTPQFVGNPDLGPERAREIEVGFEAGLLRDRLQIDFTYFYQRTRDAIVLRDIAPSSGFYREQFVNLGELENQGLELGVNGRAIDRSDLALDLQLNFSNVANKVLDVGIEGQDFISLGSRTRHQEGYPAYGIFTRRVVSAERGPDGTPINILCDGGPGVPAVDCVGAPQFYEGQSDPKVEGSFTTTVTLMNRLTVSSLVDFKLGHKRWMSHLWCPGALACEDETLPERFDVVYAAKSYLGITDEERWVMDQSFAKLREVSLRYVLPESWSQRFGADRVIVSVAGRNLHTWAPSELLGLDPENGTASSQNELPTPTQLVMKLDLTF